MPFLKGNKLQLKHGMRYTYVYGVWAGIKKRCLNPNMTGYNNYGGNGVTICDRWLKFEDFYADMGDPPTDQHQIDRIDNDGNYEPGNCRWATVQEQANNRSTNHVITFNGTTQTITQWARQLGITPNSLRLRLKKWSLEDALTKPKTPGHGNHARKLGL